MSLCHVCDPSGRVWTRYVLNVLVVSLWFVGIGCTASEATVSDREATISVQNDSDRQIDKSVDPASADTTGSRTPSSDPKEKNAASDTKFREASVVGYYAYWMKGAWMDIDLSVYDRIVFFTTTPRSDGTLLTSNGWPHAWVSLLNRADSLQIPVVPALALLEPDSIKTLFSSHEAVNNLLETSLTLIEESQGAGVHLDIELFEAVSDTLRDNFIAFTDSLAEQAMRRWPDATLSLFAPAFDNDGLYDLRRIHPGYKQLMVQGYDLHWQTGPISGPVSALKGWEGANWENILERYTEEGIDPSRIIMTIPYYGYEWPVESESLGAKTTGAAKITTFAEVDSLILPQYRIDVQSRVNTYGVKRDSISGSPYYHFSDSTGYWQGWFEDVQSLEQKYQFIQTIGLKGVATFPIGYDRGILDAHLNTFFGPKKK